MKRIYVLFFAGFLLVLNIFCWKEVFILAEKNDLEVIFFDVGQGDSAFIETPQLHQILIDGGPGSTVLGKLANQMPFWDRTIDLVILTHPEKDHIAGLLDVLQRYKADYILWTGVVKNSSEYRRWVEILEEQQKKGAKIIIAQSGKEIKAGGLLINIAHPFDNLSGQEPKNVNDTSVVSRLIFGQNSFLFTGDISTTKEKALKDVKSDVLKIAHHGSKYSTSDIFLENVQPSIAVISVGKNSYGHPTPEVLQKLEKFRIKTLRTDEKGDITILSDGNKIYIK